MLQPGLKNKKRFRVILLIVTLAVQFCIFQNITAQDIHFSQFTETPLWRNPAFGGVFNGDMRIQVSHRNQWQSVTTPYVTSAASMEFKLPNVNNDDVFTLGLQMVYDKAGTTNFKTSYLLPALIYSKSLSQERNTYLSLGIMGGLGQRSIDQDKITTSSQWDGSGYNPMLSINENLANYRLTYADASAGLSFNTSIGETIYDNLLLGVSYHHFNRPKNSFYRNPDVELKGKWVYSLGVMFGLTDRTYLTFQGNQTLQGKYSETMLGAMIGFAIDQYEFEQSKYNLHIGSYLRLKDAIIPVVKLDMKPFSVSMSYDVNISSLKAASQMRGGFELNLSYILFFQNRNTELKSTLCPRF